MKEPFGWPAATALTALVLVLGAIGLVWAHHAQPGWAVGLVLTGVGAVAAGALGGYAAARGSLLAERRRVRELKDKLTRAEERGEERAFRKLVEHLERTRSS